MSLLSLPDWWMAVWLALCARPHPDALAIDTAETAKVRERAFLEYAAKLLLVTSAASWLLLRYLNALAAAMERTTALIEAAGRVNPQMHEAIAHMAALRAFYQPAPTGDFVAPVAVLLHVVPLLMGLAIVALVTRLAVRGIGWRPAVGVGLSTGMAASIWSLGCIWASIQVLRFLPWLEQFWAALEVGNGGDDRGFDRAAGLVPAGWVQLALPSILTSVLLVVVQVLCMQRGLRQLGAGRWRATAAALAATAAVIAADVVARRLGLRDLILSLASV